MRPNQRVVNNAPNCKEVRISISNTIDVEMIDLIGPVLRITNSDTGNHNSLLLLFKIGVMFFEI